MSLFSDLRYVLTACFNSQRSPQAVQQLSAELLRIGKQFPVRLLRKVALYQAYTVLVMARSLDPEVEMEGSIRCSIVLQLAEVLILRRVATGESIFRLLQSVQGILPDDDDRWVVWQRLSGVSRSLPTT